MFKTIFKIQPAMQNVPAQPASVQLTLGSRAGQESWEMSIPFEKGKFSFSRAFLHFNALHVAQFR